MKILTLPDLRNKISNCIKDLMHYNDLGFILNNLETAILLPMPVKTSQITNEEYDIDKKTATSIFDQCNDTYLLFLEELELRKNTFEKIRNKYPSFCKNIQNSLFPEEYKKYIDLLRQVKETLNHIIRGKNSNETISSNELLLYRKDKVSSLIDSDVSIRLGNIEDTFVLKELENIDINLFNFRTQQNITKIKNDIIIRNQKFAEYSKLHSATKIQFKRSPLKEREIGD